MWMVSPPSGIFHHFKKLFLSEQAGRAQALEFVRKNVANALSMANLIMGLSSILCSLNGQYHCACWLLLIGFLLDLADGAVARQLNACSALGIPFMYRGLPCPYASSLLTGTYLLTGGNLVVLRIVAMIMILFMVDQGFYPHDKVLESQLWKKMVYAGGILMVLFSSYSIVSLYYLVWSSTYIFFPVALWSCKV
ncbi:transmembrane protein 269 isoform X3 [Chrysemys picta bellii]|uniref:transmembrane protein 269 isoform X3 n=1 Tax=Chrysemys picta bellii TaxID=8478 RepID=UPI001C682A4C|nr:transmembrane protein 269 isoform X3 [Chrysemys picta bellii]